MLCEREAREELGVVGQELLRADMFPEFVLLSMFHVVNMGSGSEMVAPEKARVLERHAVM